VDKPAGMPVHLLRVSRPEPPPAQDGRMSWGRLEFGVLSFPGQGLAAGEQAALHRVTKAHTDRRRTAAGP